MRPAWGGGACGEGREGRSAPLLWAAGSCCALGGGAFLFIFSLFNNKTLDENYPPPPVLQEPEQRLHGPGGGGRGSFLGSRRSPQGERRYRGPPGATPGVGGRSRRATSRLRHPRLLSPANLPARPRPPRSRCVRKYQVMKLHNKVEIAQGFVWDIIGYIHNRNNKIKPLSPSQVLFFSFFLCKAIWDPPLRTMRHVEKRFC